MTVLRVNTLSGIGTGGPVFDGSFAFTSQNYVILPKGTTGDRVGVGSTPGALRYNTDSNKVELYDGSQWAEVQSSRPDLNGGARGLFGGGFTTGTTNIINYINISSTGNSQDFGDLIENRSTPGSCSSSTRGIWAGGINPTPAYSNTIDYVTISSTGNAQDFGDLNAPVRRILSGCSSSTRGLFGGGYQGPGVPAYNIIDYITISATGNAVDFGDLTVGRYGLASFSSPVRGLWAGGYGAPSYKNTIDYVTISTLGNAFDFGDVGVISYYLSGCSNSTRGIYTEGIGPGAGIVNTISYVTIASTGNGIKFGDLTTRRWATSSCSSPTRGVFAGGFDTSPANVNIIDYVLITTQGNAVDFGDLGGNYAYTAGCSNAHGGL